MFAAYKRIFDRFGLQYRAVAADTGAIGGDLARVPGHCRHRRGRHRLLPDQRLRRQHRAGRGVSPRPCPAAPRPQALAKTPTPGKSTCADVAALLGLPLQRTVKSLVLATDELERAPATHQVKSRCGCCWCAVTTT